MCSRIDVENLAEKVFSCLEFAGRTYRLCERTHRYGEMKNVQINHSEEVSVHPSRTKNDMDGFVLRSRSLDSEGARCTKDNVVEMWFWHRMKRISWMEKNLTIVFYKNLA